jgi:hypothetical protein
VLQCEGMSEGCTKRIGKSAVWNYYARPPQSVCERVGGCWWPTRGLIGGTRCSTLLITATKTYRQ